MAPSPRGLRSRDGDEGLPPSSQSYANMGAPHRFGCRGAGVASGSVPWRRAPALFDPGLGHVPQLAVRPVLRAGDGLNTPAAALGRGQRSEPQQPVAPGWTSALPRCGGSGYVLFFRII